MEGLPHMPGRTLLLTPSHQLSLPCPQQRVPTSDTRPIASALPAAPRPRVDRAFWIQRAFPAQALGIQKGGWKGHGNELRALLPSPSSRGEEGPQSWGLGLPLALGLDLKEKRLIRRREKLPAFFRTLGVAVVLERSS